MKKLFLSIIALLAMASAVQAKVSPVIQLYMGTDSINITDADSIAFKNWYLSYPDNYFMKNKASLSSLDKSYTSEDSLYVYQTEGARSSVMAFQLSAVDSIASKTVAVFPEDLPSIKNPGKGQITIAVLPPKGTTCEGVGMVGSGFVRGAWTPATCMPMERHTDYIYWYTQTLEVSAGTKAEDVQIQLLALLDSEYGYSEWKYQWGKNLPGQIPNVRILKGEGNLGNSINPTLQGMKDNSVVYVEILNWDNPPCTPKNEEGLASFSLTAKNLADPTSSLQIGIVGNFDKYSNYQAWDYTHPILMQKGENGLWNANVKVSPAFEYKYVYSFDGVFTSEQTMRGNALDMPTDLKAVDAIDAWYQPISLICDLDILGIGDAVEVKTNAEADLRNLQWSLICEPEGVAEIVEIAHDNSSVWIQGLAEGSVDVIAFNGKSQASYHLVIDPKAGFLEPIPYIPAPSSGLVTVAVRVPAGSVCQGLGAVGAGFEGGVWNPQNALDFQLVDGTQTWYTVDLLTESPVDMQVKVIAYPERGKSNAEWSTQWGKNTQDQTSVSILNESDVELDNSEGGEVKAVKFVDATVVYLDIAAWENLPCVKKNEAGSATFTLIANNLPAEAKFIKIVGSFAADSEQGYWDINKGAMMEFVSATDSTPACWTVSREILVTDAFQYKYLWAAEDGIFTWGRMCDLNANFQMPLDLKANDVVDAWTNLP